jgi:pSer/pThr/pTyr-binding forkhead associated (FHA) protein
MFGERELAEPIGPPQAAPEWLEEAREALVTHGDYLAYDDGDRVRVVSLQQGWTRVGRSLSAHIRFDDPTVSRRHALVHRQEEGTRILDDRSLNGVFVNGVRVDMYELQDGDQIAVGRFCLHYIALHGSAERRRAGEVTVTAPEPLGTPVG